MEVRLSDFTEIVGTTTATVLNGIQLNTLPFLDTQRQNEETQQKLARRTYSAADAFGWFLQDTVGLVLPMGKRAIAGKLQTAYVHGLRHYIDERFAAKDTSSFHLVFASGIPNAEGLVRGVPQWSFQVWVCEADAVADYRERYPVVTAIHLDPIFTLFIETVKARGWLIENGGFRRLGEGA